MLRMPRRLGAAVIAVLIVLAAPATSSSGANIARRVHDAHVTQGAPVIVHLSARPGRTGALLKARIRPHGLTTTYRFWLELCTGSECIDDVLIGEGTIAATTEAQTVEASTYPVFHEHGLAPGSTWEYWVTATNQDGSTRLAKTFKTRG
jgi:hypothetical protein